MPYMEIKNQREFLVEWIRRLRSGEYEQGQGALRKRSRFGEDAPDAFCCIGVACEVAVDSGRLLRFVLPDWNRAYEYGEKNNTSGNERSAIGWPLSLQSWLGQESKMHPSILSSVLVRMNDGDDKSFIDIANYLEHEVLAFIPEKE